MFHFRVGIKRCQHLAYRHVVCSTGDVFSTWETKNERYGERCSRGGVFAVLRNGIQVERKLCARYLCCTMIIIVAQRRRLLLNKNSLPPLSKATIRRKTRLLHISVVKNSRYLQNEAMRTSKRVLQDGFGFL